LTVLIPVREEKTPPQAENFKILNENLNYITNENDVGGGGG
jgi:hypothetical protein